MAMRTRKIERELANRYGWEMLMKREREISQTGISKIGKEIIDRFEKKEEPKK